MIAHIRSNLNPLRTPFLCAATARLVGAAVVFVFCLLGAAASSVSAQSNISGKFVGEVRDRDTRAAIAGARATFRNRRTGAVTTAITDSSGIFSKSALSPDDYEIEVTADGYDAKSIVQPLYTMVPTPVVPVPFDLIKQGVAGPVTAQPTPAPNQTAQVVPITQVSSGEEVVRLEASRGGAFDIRAVRGLPLGSTTLTRTFDELAFLIPGVYLPPQAIGNTVGPGVGGGVGTSGQFSVNGLRSRANNFTVDGSDNNDEDIGVRRQGFFTLVPQPIESIQEFQIITLLAPAEFGRNLGAQVNAVSQGGGNRFHGTIFGLGNADFLNARNFFDNAGGDTSAPLQAGQGVSSPESLGAAPTCVLFDCPRVVPVFRTNENGVTEQVFVTNDAGEKDAFSLLQGGFTFGGPLVSEKLFFFGSAELQHMDGTRERHFAVPTVAQRGILGTGASGFIGEGPNNTVVPLYPSNFVAEAVYSLFPFPNDPNGVYGANTYTKALSIDARGLILSGRLDYNLFADSERPQTLTGRYNFTDDRRDLTDVGGALFSAIRPLVRTDNFSMFLTGGLSENVSNEFRFSYGRTRLRFEELRDDFLRPVETLNEGEDTRFLLNAPYFSNNTIPICATNTLFCDPDDLFLPTQVDYFRAFRFDGLPANTENSDLGPVGQVIIGGFSPVGVDVFNFPQQRENNTFQFADTLRWNVTGSGRHSLAFGTDIRRTYLESDLPRNSRPLITFFGGICTNPDTLCPRTAGFATPLDFVASGAATGAFQSLVLPGKDAKIDLSYYQLNFFAQDEWRVAQNFSLNLGLRYELNTTPKEADRKIEDTFGGTPVASGLATFIDGRTNIYETDRNNFAPRIGFAYAPASSTVIRGGFGMYFDQILGAVVSQSRNVFPTFTTVNFGGGAFANSGGIFSIFNPRDALFDPVSGQVCSFADILAEEEVPCDPATSIFLIQQGTLNTLNPNLSETDLRRALASIFSNFPSGSLFGTTLPTRELDTPFSYQYSIGVEHNLFGDTVLSAAYVGTMGRNLLRFTTPNLGGNFVSRIDGFFFDDTVCPRVDPGFCTPLALGSTDAFAPRPVPNAGAVNQFETTGRSRYDSLQLELRGRLSRSFQYRTNYVYGKVKDDVSDVFDLAGAFSLPQNSLTGEGEYAPANFDVRHRFTYNFIYDTPLLRSRTPLVEFLFGGWQIAGTGKFSTGQPFTVNTIFDINQDGNLTDRLDNLNAITITGDRRQPLILDLSAPLGTILAPFGEDGSIPRNSFRAGNILELDMAFMKRFRVRETQDLQLRLDVFNFINRANFGIPVRFLEFPSFGRAIETVTPGRRFQLMVRYNF